jgi:hypothetical protein
VLQFLKKNPSSKPGDAILADRLSYEKVRNAMAEESIDRAEAQAVSDYRKAAKEQDHVDFLTDNEVLEILAFKKQEREHKVVKRQRQKDEKAWLRRINELEQEIGLRAIGAEPPQKKSFAWEDALREHHNEYIKRHDDMHER